jgi:hypothetical protein
LIQLEILALIEKRIGLGIPIQEFFDLIVGTRYVTRFETFTLLSLTLPFQRNSGGGIVALAIGEKNMTVYEAVDMFTDFAKRAFSRRWGANVPVWGRLVQLKYHSQYETMGLESALKEAFGQDLLFGGKRHLQSPSRCKVAITTTDTNREARLLANYNRGTKIKTPYQFQRFEKPDQELFTWEAARATSAAPGFFKSFYHPRNSHTYQDGALKLNNPVLAADYERLCIWGEGPQSIPDVLVSIGTGYFPDAKIKSSDPGPRTGIGLMNGAITFVNIAKDAIESELDCDKTWEEYVQCAIPEASERRNRYHRLTLEIPGPKVELDAVNEMSRLQDLTRTYYTQNPHLIDKVAGQLIASLFYFKYVSRVSMTVTGRYSTSLLFSEDISDPRLPCSGIIKCRLPQDIAPIGSLERMARGLRRMRFTSEFFSTPPTFLKPSIVLSSPIPNLPQHQLKPLVPSRH